MVARLITLLSRETRDIHAAAYILAACALLSQILALLRDRLLAGTFGAGSTLDVYYTAFRIPDFLFATVASLLSLYALMPVLSELEARSESSSISFMRRTLWVFFAAMGAISLAVFIFVPYFIPLIAPGIAASAAANAQLILLTRILLLQPILLGASNILANLTQLKHRFALYAVSPLLYNIGIIIGIVALYPMFGIAGLAWGVVLGALMHVLVQVPLFSFQRAGEPIPWNIYWRHLRDVLVLSVPRTGALAAGQISLMALVALASTLAAGSVAIFSFAYNLQAVPLTIIGVSYSVAAFPTLARLFAAGERKDFLAHIEQALRHIAFWAIPATVLVIVLRAQLVRVILGAGVFDWSATRLTAAALALFVLSLFAQSAVLIIMRAYYAAGSTKKPLLLAILSVAVSVGSAYALVHLFDNSETVRLWFDTLLRVDAGTAPEAAGNTATVLMLALGYALGSVTQCILGLTLFAQDFNLSLAPLRRLFLQSTFASVLGGLAAYLALAVVGIWLGGLHTLPAIFLQGLLAGLTGLAITALLLHLQQNQELKEITKALHHRIRGVPVTVEPTDLEAA